MSESEREELHRKLEEVRHRRNIEDLRRKRERIKLIEEEFLSNLPPELREQFDRLPGKDREGLIRFAMGRMKELLHDEFLKSLTDQEKERLGDLRGPERIEGFKAIERERALAALPEEERARLAALPEAERAKAEREVCHRAHQKIQATARAKIAGEIEELMKLSPDERRRKLGRRGPRGGPQGGPPGGPRRGRR
jgi:hypothetical protein